MTQRDEQSHQVDATVRTNPVTGLLWILIALVGIALTVGIAYYTGMPRNVVVPRVSEDDRLRDLDFTRIRETVRLFSGASEAEPFDSRMTGSEGAEVAFEYLKSQVEALGLPMEVHEFDVVLPVTQEARLVYGEDGTAEISLYPVWPNLARTSQTPAEGISGRMMDAGSGTDEALSGKELSGRIVVVDWDCLDEWLSVPEFGGKVVLFRGSKPATSGLSVNKFLGIPGNIPRFYVRTEDIPALDALLATPDVEATVLCKQSWERRRARNLLVEVNTGPSTRTVGDPDTPLIADQNPIVFTTHYDSLSIVPDLAPGGEQAISPAVALELAHYFRGRKLDRPVYLLFEGGHGQSMAGMIDFVGRLRDGRKAKWVIPEGAEEVEGWAKRGSLMESLAEPGLILNMDLSTHGDQYGVFCSGNFRNQYEHLIRPKYSQLALNLGAHARNVRTPEGAEVSPEGSFVDGINLTLGRQWWTYFPYRAGFASEVATLAGFPSVTFSTINDERRYVDTPDDTFERLRFDILERQLAVKQGDRAGLTALATALALWKGPFVNSDLEDTWAEIDGRVVWLDQRKNYTPNEPLKQAPVFLKILNDWAPDKILRGTRGIPVVLTDDEGRFHYRGLIQMTQNAAYANCNLEAYGVATKSFMEANSDAMGEFRKVLREGGRDDLSVPADGSLIFGLDMARPDDYRWQIQTKLAEQTINLVCFPCRAFSLLGLTDPRGYLALSDLQLLEASTKSQPFQYGRSVPDGPPGGDTEDLVTLWADPTIRVMITLGVGMARQRLVLINNSPENPEGEGFVLEDLKTLPSMVLQGARDMWTLNESRIAKLEANGVSNPRVTQFHEEAREALDKAEKALEEHDYQTYRSASEQGWALEGKAYGETLGIINNMIHGILFYLALLLPLSYCMERLTLASQTIKGRIIGICSIFAACFLVLAFVHPAFRFTMTPFLVLLAFVILALVVTVSVLLVGRVDHLLQERKVATTGRHEDQQKMGGVAIRAVDLGISNIRRRPQRGVLTALSVVMVTFILLSFTSLVPTTTISRLTHPEGVATYEGLLVRDRAWGGLPNPLYQAVRRNFALSNKELPEGEDVRPTVVAPRAWFYSDFSGMNSQIDLQPVDEGTLADEVRATNERNYLEFTAPSLLCLSPSEPKVTDVARILTAGRWFEREDEVGVILSEHAARQLGYGEADLGKRVRIFGQEIPLVGLFDGTVLDEIEDLDGEPLTPVNFKAQQEQMAETGADPSEADTLQEYIHHPANQIAILPFRFGHRLGQGAAIRSIGINAGSNTDVEAEAEGYTKRSNLTILASNGETVTLYAALDTSQMSAAWQIVVPLFLGFIMILGTMLGSVYERQREIFVYNSVGLNPTSVSGLFLAESTVYAIVGAGLGYLLGQAVSKGLQVTQLLSGLSLNYTAGGTIFVTVLTMLIVVISAIYPARRAFHAAIPDVERDEMETGGDGSGDTISFFLPFVTTPGSLYAMQAYMSEWLESIQGITIGQVAVDDLAAHIEEVDGRDVPVLTFRAWMAPFDLGISHDAELRIIYRPDRDVYQYHLTATRFSGDQQNWRRLTPRFVNAVRKQMLMWRIQSTEDQERYRRVGNAMFDAESSDEA